LISRAGRAGRARGGSTGRAVLHALLRDVKHCMAHLLSRIDAVGSCFFRVCSIKLVSVLHSVMCDIMYAG
jgi:hypothetical protein